MMNFKEMKDLVIKTSGADPAELGFSFSPLGGVQGWTDVRSIHEDFSIAGNHIHVTLREKSLLSMHFCVCNSPKEQNGYERRVIRCSLDQGIAYDKQPVLLLNVEKAFVDFDYSARIIYIGSGSIYTVKNGHGSMELHIAALDYEKVTKSSYLLTDILSPRGHKQWEANSADEAPWLEKIVDEMDFFKSPLNLKFHSEVKYLEFHASGQPYWGENLFYVHGSLEAVRLGGLWIRTQVGWIDVNYEDLPQEVRDEYLLMKSMEV